MTTTLVLYALLMITVATIALLSMLADPGLATIHGWATIAVALVWALVCLLYADHIQNRDS